MKKLILLIGCCMFFVSTVSAQKVGVQTNLLGWAAYGTMNGGVEAAIIPNVTLDVDGYYNPFTFNDGKSAKMWGIQPELRYWLQTKFTGLYVGAHSLYSSYDCGVSKYRYDGWITGAGLGVGYSYPITDRMRVVAGIGAGWKHMDYLKTGLPRVDGRDIIYYGDFVTDTFGITKAEISFQFIIR